MIRLQTPLPETYTKASADQLAVRIAVAKAALGERLMILGHHYQRDDVIQWADSCGDSFGLSRSAAANTAAEYIVFCGVHFMAESADILTADHQKVLLPDLNAGCSMADMADIDAVEEAWASIANITDIKQVVPITYMNSSAALKSFVGNMDGAVCTSSNAHAVIKWALRRGRQLLFFPDQHLGRNTAHDLGFRDHDMRVWDPAKAQGGLEDREVKSATFLLWKGHCSVHQRFLPEHVHAFRSANPDGIVVVHPECAHSTVIAADQVGSTDYIINSIREAPSGATIAVGTEIHLVRRLAKEHPDKRIVSLDPLVCPCSTMSRIDPAHLAWILDEIVAGSNTNQIVVPPAMRQSAKLALDRMLSLRG